MARFDAKQSDLFAPPEVPRPEPEPPRDPMVQLQAMLDWLTPQTEFPWATIAVGMQYESPVIYWRQYGSPEVVALADKVAAQIDRLARLTDGPGTA